MGKSYDTWVNPQNTPRFAERRLLFLLAASILAGNLLFFAVYCAMPVFFVGILAVIGFSVVQLLDTRKAHWTPWCLTVFIVFSFLDVFLMIWAYEVYWYFAVWAAEVLLFGTLCFFILRKPGKKG